MNIRRTTEKGTGSATSATCENGDALSRLGHNRVFGRHSIGDLPGINPTADGLTASDLPRLAVIVDFGVERTSGGSLLLYRLLARYPSDRLLVIYDPGQVVEDPSTFLPGVTYRPYSFQIPRLVRNRFNPAWPVLMAEWMRWHTARLSTMLVEFETDAVVTVPHWYLWFAAARAACRAGIPFHLIIHDDWPCYTTFRLPGRVWDVVRWACQRVMAPVYQQAASRLCVSPGMEERYQACFAVDGTVVYPTRGDDSPPGRIRVRPDPDGSPVVAFCGNIHLGGTADLLRQMADLLAPLGGSLDLYTQATDRGLAAHRLDLPSVRLRGFFPAAEMGERVGRTAHALFLPASFDSRERIDISTLFPCKLADYTAIGLPILVWGPGYSSAVRWAADHPSATVCITDTDPAVVQSAVARLAADPEYATKIAFAGMTAGATCFDPAPARNALYNALRKGSQSARRDCANVPAASQIANWKVIEG